MIQRSENAVVYFVSTTGCDTNTGLTVDQPFKTVHKAKEAVRKLLHGNMSSDVVVYLRGGEYYLEKPLIFDEGDSGRNGYKVIYCNYPDEVPVINGGYCVSQWEQHDRHVYKTKIEDGKLFNILYENGLFATKARYPKNGYIRTAAANPDALKKSFCFQEDLPYIENADDLQVYLWPGGPDGEWNWYAHVMNVQQVDYDEHRLDLQHEAEYEIGKGSRYYIQGAKQLITQPGEFYLDKQENMLYYYPMNVPIEKQEVVIPRMRVAVGFNGKSESNPVRGIVWSGIGIRNTDIEEETINVSTDLQEGGCSAVHIENAEDITITHCKIYNAGYHGIYLKGYAQNNRISNNLIYNIGNTGVQLEGAGETLNFINRKNVIENNCIHHTGWLVGHGAGIMLIHSGENSVRHNRIYHTPRYSISMKSICPSILSGKTIDGMEVTEENTELFCHTRKNVIEYNDLSKANLDSQDTGVIESWGRNADNIIRYNYIHDSNIYFSFGFGIYIDDAGLRFTIQGNVIAGLQKEGGGKLLYAIYDKGYQDRICNNVMVNNRVFRAAIGTFEMVEKNKGIYSENNIMVDSGDIYYFQNWDNDRFAYSNRNLFWNKEGRYGILNEIRDYVWGSKELGGIEGIKWNTLDLKEWGDVGGKGFDKDSLIADPLFEAPETGDFRLRYDSPAYSLGFQAIDYGEIGLKKSFPFKLDEGGL